MKALILGATGAVGRDLTSLLLSDDAFEEVDIFVRRNPDMSHPKLHVHIVDFDHFEEWSHLIVGDVAFLCMGTTLKSAGSKEAQYLVDFTYQYSFADFASRNGVPGFVLVSSTGADDRSRFFYMNMKGKLETEVSKLPFRSISILQPPALIRKDTDRLSERLSLPVIKFFNHIGLFLSQKPMPTSTVAKAMATVARRKEGIAVLSAKDIRELAGE